MIKVKKIKSILGKQDNLVEDTTYERMPEYMNIANGIFVRRNRTTSSIIPYRFNISLNTTHTYFIGVMFNETIANLGMYNYDATNNVNTSVSNKISVGNFVCGTVTNVQKIDSIHFYQGSGGISETAIPLYAMYIDLTEYGLGNLTPQQFYDNYSSIFADIAGNKLSSVKKIFTKHNGMLTAVKKRYIKNNNYHLLPQGYTLVDGITTDGTAYIDTGIVPDITSKWDFEGDYKIAQNGDQVILGCREDDGNTRFFPFATAPTSGVMKSNYGYSTYCYGNEITLNIKNHITTHLEAGRQSSQVEGSSAPDTRGLSFPTGTVLTKSMFLFRNNYRAPNECKSGFTVYYIKVVKDGVKVGEFVSCKRDSDNTYGMYDFVTNTFKGNANTSGTFTGGQEIVEVEYLGYNNENGSFQYINTGIIGTTTSGLTVYVDAEGVNQTNNGILVSANSGSTGGHWFGTSSSHNWSSGTGAESNVPATTRIQTTITFGTKVEWTLNGITYSRLGNVPSTSDATIIGFNKATYHFRGKLYVCKIWNDDNLVRDFVPVRIGTVGYMLDIANWRIYENKGTGAFTYGDDVLPYKIVFNALPSEYQEVEYLQGDGSSYIELDIGYSSNTKAYIKLQNRVSENEAAFGVYSSDNGGLCLYCFKSERGFYSFLYSTTRIEMHQYDTNINTFLIDLKESFVEFNGVRTTRTKGEDFSDSSYIVLFGRKADGSTGYKYSGKIFEYKQWEGDRLVSTLIPCYRKNDNIAGMYDIVRRRFYTNQGTGNFTCGREIY